MEHRWGTRHSIDLPIRLDARPRALAVGRLLNASSSGAYVETSAAPPLMTRVHVELEWDVFRRDEPYRIPAYVIRLDGAGVGLEWCDFAPLPIIELIEDRQWRTRSEWRRRPMSPEVLPLPEYGVPVQAAERSRIAVLRG